MSNYLWRTVAVSAAGVASKFPSLSPLVQNMLAQKVVSAVGAWALDPEEEAIISQIKAAAAAAGLDVKDKFDIDKFDADKLIMGLPPDAGLGVANFLNHPQGQEGLFSEMGKGLPALLGEIEKNGTAEEKNCAKYVIDDPAGSHPPNITFQNGWSRATAIPSRARCWRAGWWTTPVPPAASVGCASRTSCSIPLSFCAS